MSHQEDGSFHGGYPIYTHSQPYLQLLSHQCRCVDNLKVAIVILGSLVLLDVNQKGTFCCCKSKRIVGLVMHQDRISEKECFWMFLVFI